MRLAMTSDAPTYAEKHVTSNIACACIQRYTKDCLKWRYALWRYVISHFLSDQVSFQIVQLRDVDT